MVVVNKPKFLRCAITDLASSLDTPAARLERIREQTRRWAVDGIDIVQLREKWLESGELLALAEAARSVLREVSVKHGQSTPHTKLLVNGRADVALAAVADGAHLSSHPGELTPAQARHLFARAGLAACLVTLSCHSVQEVLAAHESGADLLLFGPVLEKCVGGKRVQEGLGWERLREACAAAGALPVLALGGIRPADTAACLAAGAAGIAGIRLFDTGQQLKTSKLKTLQTE